ncbi:TetR/AcrR family transcriptional regulator [Nocardia sp. NPDC058705]|uniref:TetR/AcrR family transcriptional regulator n=1 Tax=Nocardia sp. NPDC058705 TaxID=3346609 RepID=UPI0036CFC8E3
MTHTGSSLWSRGATPRPGPRPAYTLDQLADACVRRADAGGLRAVSMRGVADELGTAAASLYRYVDGKDDLIALMVDRVAGEYRYADSTGDVRADVLALAEQSRALHRAHPWLVSATPSSMGPNSVRYMDRMAGALAPTGLDASAIMMGVAMLSSWGANFAAQESAGLSAGDLGGALAASAGDSARDYPNLTMLFGSAASAGAGAAIDNDTVFVAGIDALLFGILPRS